MNVYCTLFDSNYLDKGLVLYRSLCRCEKEFRLYVFAFDDRCREILEKESLDHMTVVSLAEFETPELLKVKAERTRAEYCWTCTPWTIRYVLEHYGEDSCTYIDADMMFFSSPDPIFQDMRQKNCSVLITPHRFGNTPKDRQTEAHVGTYCVEFNTFLNNEDGRRALNWWADRCLDWCFYAPAGTSEWYGDQKYLEVFPKEFSGVYICNHYGAGIAPWNASQLRLVPGTGEVEVTAAGERYPVVFCHFATIMHLTQNWVNVNSGVKDPALHRFLYDTYMDAIRQERAYLKETYALELYVRRRVTRNPLYAFYQQFLSPLLHLRRLSDLYHI